MKLAELENLRLEMINSKKSFDYNFLKFVEHNFGSSIGDKIKVNTSSFHGKEMIINRFSGKFDNWKKEYIGVAHGFVLNKDGKESKNEARSEISLGLIK